jgi:hypothetical protein
MIVQPLPDPASQSGKSTVLEYTLTDEMNTSAPSKRKEMGEDTSDPSPTHTRHKKW